MLLSSNIIYYCSLLLLCCYAIISAKRTDIARHNPVLIRGDAREESELFLYLSFCFFLPSYNFHDYNNTPGVIITRVFIYNGPRYGIDSTSTRRRVPVTIFVRKFRGLGHAVGSRFIRFKGGFLSQFLSLRVPPDDDCARAGFPSPPYIFTVRYLAPRDRGGEASRVKGAVSRALAHRETERESQGDDAIGRNNDALERRTQNAAAAAAALLRRAFFLHFSFRKLRDHS